MQLEVREQDRLSLGRCAELVLSGIHYRLFRAAITVAIVGLAVAFLMTMLTESLVGRRVAEAVRERTAPRSLFLFWVDRLSTPLTPSELTRALAVPDPEEVRSAELRTWGRLTEANYDELRRVAAFQHRVLRFFRELGEGRLRPLVGRARGHRILEHLQDPANRDTFENQLRTMGRQMPMSLSEFRAFLDKWRETRPTFLQIIDGHARAREGATRILGTGEIAEALARASDDLAERLAPLGFRMSRADLDTVREQARLELDTRRLEALLAVPMVKQRLAIRLNAERVAQVSATELFSVGRSKRGAKWLLDTVRDAKTPVEMELSRVRAVSRAFLERTRLVRVEAALPEAARRATGFGFSRRVWSLIMVSLLVCIVGIANAMLMSVTERFQEIATMKCLGATDRFIMVNFILESCLQGIAGGVAGAALGFLLGILRGAFRYGGLAFAQVPWGQIVAAGVSALAMGVAISALAAVYPAWVAARLAPMEAMRVE